MAPDKASWARDRPPDDPYVYRVVTVGHGGVDPPAAKDLVEQLHAGVDAILVAVGGVASRSTDDERGESTWLLAPPRAEDLADMVVAVVERLNPGSWRVERF
jgi:hypothetical protein